MKFDFSKLQNIQTGKEVEVPKVEEIIINTSKKSEAIVDSKPTVKEEKVQPKQINEISKPVENNAAENKPRKNNIIELDKSLFELSEKDLKDRVRIAVSKMNKIDQELNCFFIERNNEINMLILALVSSTNAFLHGPAGTGKSLLTEELANRIESSNYFRILMGKTTEPAEVFGPVSLNAMKKDSYKVNTTNKLPTSHLAFLDEVFKANSAVLNSLLTIMNEKLFFNDEVEEVPTISVIGASNEYIEDESLVALYDRFLLRWHVDYIQDVTNRMNLFTNFLGSRNNSCKFSSQPEVAATGAAETTIDIQELMLLNEFCKSISVPAKVLKIYNTLYVNLEKKGICVSDRRKNEALKVIQASALLANRDVVEVEDFEPLKYILWNEQKDLQIIVDEINKLANPNQVKYDGFLKSLTTYKAELAEIEERKDTAEYSFDKSIKITEINKTLQFTINSIDKMLAGMSNGSKDFDKFFALKKDIVDYLEEVKKQIL